MKKLNRIYTSSVITVFSVFLLSVCGGGGGSTAKSWGTPTLIETDDAGIAADPQIASDGNGNVLAV